MEESVAARGEHKVTWETKKPGLHSQKVNSLVIML